MSEKRSKSRLTYRQARKLFPDEWVVFTDTKIDLKAGAFVDGTVYWHGQDPRESFAKASELPGPSARFFTGTLPYRRVTLQQDNALRRSKSIHLAW